MAQFGGFFFVYGLLARSAMASRFLHSSAPTPRSKAYWPRGSTLSKSFDLHAVPTIHTCGLHKIVDDGGSCARVLHERAQSRDTGARSPNTTAGNARITFHPIMISGAGA